MGYLVFIRMNHFGRVCSGDYISNTNLAGYDSSMADFYKQSIEKVKGKYMGVLSILSAIFLAYLSFAVFCLVVIPCIKRLCKTNRGS